jgi:hypothetical protein
MNGLVDFIAANAGRYVSLAELQSRALEVALTHYLFGDVPTSIDIAKRVAGYLYAEHLVDAPTPWMADAWRHGATDAERHALIDALCGRRS